MANTTLAKKNWDNRTHVAQARDLSSMHAPMFGLRACLNFFGQGSTTSNWLNDSKWHSTSGSNISIIISHQNRWCSTGVKFLVLQGAFAKVPRWASGRMVWPDWVGIAGSISARSVIETSQPRACKGCMRKHHVHDVRSALACMDS